MGDTSDVPQQGHKPESAEEVAAAAAGRERSRSPPRTKGDVPNGDENKASEECSGGRERSRTPPRTQTEEPAEEAESGNWAARWREAMGRKLGWAAPVEGEKPAATDEEVGDAAEAAPVEAAEEPAAPATPLPFPCLGCEKGFGTEEAFRKHMHASAICGAEPFQAVVEAMSCMPGAGTRLWCPACSEADARGQWSGPARRAGALLRHLSAAVAEKGPTEASHRRLQRALIELLLVDLPSDVDAEALQEWAGTARLLAAVGPLLAKPSAAARTAIQKLEDEVLGADPSCTARTSEGSAEAKVEDVDGGDEPGPEADSDQKRLRILGLDLTLDDTVSSGLYDDVVPLNAIPGAADAEVAAAEAETVDAGRNLGCALPAGGIAGLRCFDLTLSSSEDEAPVPAAVLSTSGAGEGSGAAAVVASGVAEGGGAGADDEDDDNLEFV